MTNEYVLGFRLSHAAHFGTFLMIYALLSQNFDVEIYALFLQMFCDWKADSTNFFAFRMYDYCVFYTILVIAFSISEHLERGGNCNLQECYIPVVRKTWSLVCRFFHSSQITNKYLMKFVDQFTLQLRDSDRTQALLAPTRIQIFKMSLFNQFIYIN